MTNPSVSMIVSIIKKSALDIWEEALYLIIFNLIWFVGAILILPLPFVTFGFFFTVYEIGQGKGIKFSTFFGHARRMLKPAYIWGGINLAVYVLSWINLMFYGQLQARWAAIVQMIIIALILFWTLMQLITLALYPRLERPGFRLALRNAAAVMGLQPLAIFTLLIIIILISVVTLFFQAIAFLATTAIIVAVTNRTVEAILEQALKDDKLVEGEPGDEGPK